MWSHDCAITETPDSITFLNRHMNVTLAVGNVFSRYITAQHQEL